MPVSEEMVSISKAFKTLCPGADLRDGEMIQLAEAMASPRTMKTHLPFSLISPDVMEHANVMKYRDFFMFFILYYIYISFFLSFVLFLFL